MFDNYRLILSKIDNLARQVYDTVSREEMRAQPERMKTFKNRLCEQEISLRNRMFLEEMGNLINDEAPMIINLDDVLKASPA